jgi:hypothetical protein
MRKLAFLAAVPLLAAGIGLAAAEPAGADAPTTCSGTINGGDIGGNLEVLAGDFCLLQNTHVGGSVQLHAGALGVSLLGGNTVDGNVQSLHDIVFDVRVFDSTVGGNIEVRNMHSGTVGGMCRDTVGRNVIVQDEGGFFSIGEGGFDICPAGSGNHIEGNLILTNNSGGNLVQANTIDHSMHVDGNSGPEQLTGNTVAQTMECQGNTGPFIGPENTARYFVGQCTS